MNYIYAILKAIEIMRQAEQIFNKIERKRIAIDQASNWISLNPLSCITEEMRESRDRKRLEMKELEKELDILYQKSL